jgi:hypothetical protein
MRPRRTVAPRPFPALELAFLGVSTFCIVAVLAIATPTMRYVADFAALLDVSAVLAWFYVDQRLETAPVARTATRWIFMTLLVVSVVMGVLFALPPPYHYADG